MTDRERTAGTCRCGMTHKYLHRRLRQEGLASAAGWAGLSVAVGVLVAAPEWWMRALAVPVAPYCAFVAYFSGTDFMHHLRWLRDDTRHAGGDR